MRSTKRNAPIRNGEARPWPSLPALSLLAPPLPRKLMTSTLHQPAHSTRANTYLLHRSGMGPAMPMPIVNDAQCKRLPRQKGGDWSCLRLDLAFWLLFYLVPHDFSIGSRALIGCSIQYILKLIHSSESLSVESAAS